MEPKSRLSGYPILNLLACGVLAAVIGVLFGIIPVHPDQVSAYVWTGLILSLHIALVSLKQLPSEERWARWWEPFLCLFLVGGACLLVAPVFAPGRNSSKSRCLSNVKMLAVAMHIYSTDYDDRFPPVEKWKGAVSPYIKNDLAFGPCPTTSAAFAYALNQAVAGEALASFKEPAKLVLLFECISKNSSPYGGEIHFNRSHNNRGAVAFVDSHAKMIENKPGDARWTP